MLEAHHAAWLSAHPERSEEWLRSRLSDGFDVHHVDGDRSNDAPENLCLIEHLDHMRLHKMKMNRLKTPARRGPRGPHRRALAAALDQEIFEAAEQGVPKRDLAKRHGVNRNAIDRAIANGAMRRLKEMQAVRPGQDFSRPYYRVSRNPALRPTETGEAVHLA